MTIQSLALILSISNACLARQLPHDTSFTIQSAYEKEVTTRPYMKIAHPLSSSEVCKKTDVVYRRVGERNLLLDIFYPVKRKKAPAILLIFGGGWRSGDKTQNHAMATGLVNAGYVAVSAEYRLSPEAIYPAAILDLKSAIRWMRASAQQYGIDTSKIAVMGGSAGGQLAALIATTNGNVLFEDTIGNKNHSSAVQAVIDMDGILAFKHPESRESTSASLWFGGDYEHKTESWEQASPLNHVDKNSAPILFINSSTIRFHAGRDDMIKKLNGFGIYSEVHEFADSPHPFWFFHPWFKPTMKYTINFLKKIFKQ